MRIAIDFTSFIPQMTGVDTYLTRLLWHLAKIDRVNRYRIYHNYEDLALLADRLPENFSLCALSARPRPARLFFQQVLLPAVAGIWKADVVHSPSFIGPYVRGSARHVLTVHDMTFFSHPHCHIPLRRSLPYQRMVLASLRRTDVVVVPSQATRNAILKYVPGLESERIRVTVPGISEEFRPINLADVQNVVARLALPQPYMLYVGTLEPRKNLSALVESYRRLIETGGVKEHLVLAGKLGWGYESLLKQIDTSSVRGQIHLAGYVSQEDLPAVYAGARLFVYPSLHEGFGFPPLEAMACGVPVISTRSSSLVENLEGAAELVPPNDSGALTEAMRQVLTDDGLWANRRTQGLERVTRYRWDETARTTVSSYEAALTIEGPRGRR